MSTKKKREAMLVQEFVREPDSFFLGMKPLNVKSVDAAKGMKMNVIPVVAKHLCREIPAEACRSGGRIDPSRSALNYSLVPGMMSEAAIAARAITVMEEHRINWQRLRKDKIMGVELVFSLSPESKCDLGIYFTECLEWTKRHFQEPAQIIAAIVHLDEDAPHLHIVIVPIVEPGRMDGHKLAGYVGLYARRVNSFHDEVAQGFGLRKPRPKVNLTSTQRHHLADRIIAQLMADGWVGTPASVKAMLREFVRDPLPIAESMGVSVHDAVPLEPETTAYAVAVDSAPALPDGATALLCIAVHSSASTNDAPADMVETTLTAPAASSGIIPSQRPRPKKWVDIMTRPMTPERPAWKPSQHQPIPPPIIVSSKPEHMASVVPEPTQHIQPPNQTSARSQIMLGLRAASHMRGRAW